MRTRAVDNGVYLVAATYYDKGGLIVHPDGRGLVEAHGKEGVHTADVELTNSSRNLLKDASAGGALCA